MDDRYLEQRFKDIDRRIEDVEELEEGMRQAIADVKYLRSESERRKAERTEERKLAMLERRADRRALWAVCATILVSLIGAATAIIVAFS